MVKQRRYLTHLLILGIVCLLSVSTAWAQITRIYTSDADFDEGALINVNHDAPNNDQLQLHAVGEAFDFIWVAASGRGTIVKIDTRTGDVLGEYWSAPQNRPKNPSRTTVDANGNVWAGNRDEGSPQGSVVHVGLLENGQCVDRNGNGTIETSTGLGNILPWPNDSGVDSDGGVETAEDECIIHYVRTAGSNVRTVAVDANNDVWVGGYGNRVHEKIGSDGIPVAGTQFNLNCGGYGGLIDGNGILWSANVNTTRLLRYDPATSSGACVNIGRTTYGLGIDSNGYIWTTNWTINTITKVAPDGTVVAAFPTGGASGDRGVAVTPADNDVWVANSLGSDVSRLANDGTLKAVISVGQMPTGVAVDAEGKVWVTNHNSNNVMRIDPATETVDLTVDLGVGATPYNYSDMTGSTLTAPPTAGTWTIVHDTGLLDAEWGYVTWTADVPSNTDLAVTAASSTDGVTFGPPEPVVNGAELTVANGQYLRVSVSFTRAPTVESPVLYDLTISANRPPDCADAAPTLGFIWPPNHQMVEIGFLGVTDPDGDPLAFLVTGITQDEPLETVADGSFEPDGEGVGTPMAWLRAERVGTKKVPGNGRVYQVAFTASDGRGGECSAAVQVCVPHDMGRGWACVDDGQIYDATGVTMAPKTSTAPVAVELEMYPNPFNPVTTIRFTLPEAGDVSLVVYDLTGRQVAVLAEGAMAAGTHEVRWHAERLSSGVYLCRLSTERLTQMQRIVLLK